MTTRRDDEGSNQGGSNLCAVGRTSNHLAFVGEITAGARVIHRRRGFGYDVAEVCSRCHRHRACNLHGREAEPDAEEDCENGPEELQAHDGNNRVTA